MRRQGYRFAIAWIAANDDTEWCNEDDTPQSVTAALVADIFGVDDARVRKDLCRELQRQNRKGNQ